jgi:hypothetical protein
MVLGFGVFSTLLWHVLGGSIGQTFETRASAAFQDNDSCMRGGQLTEIAVAQRGPRAAKVFGNGFTTPIDGMMVDFRSDDRGEVVQDNRSRLEMTRSLTVAFRRSAPSRDRKGAL